MLAETRTAGAHIEELHESTDSHWQGQGGDIRDVGRLKKELERAEGELFEARMQLQAKVKG